MPRHPFIPPQGRIEWLEIRSELLGRNLIGDPSTRRVGVYLPPGYDQSDQRYPLMVDLVGYTGSGPKHLAWRAFEESVPQRVDRLVREGEMGPVIVAFPDAFTSLGGNQYIDSSAMGPWASFLTEEMLPALEQRYRLASGRSHRAVFGKSSGGYGALMHGMRRADFWGAVACHSGDMAFELCYAGGFPSLAAALVPHRGDPAAFVDELRFAPRVSGSAFHDLMTVAMAATYDPDPEARYGLRLPFDPHTCERVEERWRAWLVHDPVECIERSETQEALGRVALYLDCGSRDQYHLHLGARRMVRKLERAGVVHHYEEFDGTHSHIDHRMDRSLPWLYAAIS